MPILAYWLPKELEWLILLDKSEKHFFIKVLFLFHFIFVFLPTRYLVLQKVWLYVIPFLVPFYFYLFLHGHFWVKVFVVFHVKLILKGFFSVLLGYFRPSSLPSSKEKMDNLALSPKIRATFFGDYGKDHLPLASGLLLTALIFLCWYIDDFFLPTVKDYLHYHWSHLDVDEETRSKIFAQIIVDRKQRSLSHSIFSEPTLSGSFRVIVNALK